MLPSMKARMLGLLMVVFMAGALPLAAEEVTAVRVQFRGEVLKVGALTRNVLSFEPVHANPHFFLKLRVAGEPPEVLGWKAGDIVMLGIHSFIELFAGEPDTGKVYDFSIAVARRGGKPRYLDLKVESVPPGK